MLSFSGLARLAGRKCRKTFLSRSAKAGSTRWFVLRCPIPTMRCGATSSTWQAKGSSAIGSANQAPDRQIALYCLEIRTARLPGLPEYQVRFRCTPNAVLVWDNQATGHYPVADYWPARRHMGRVTIRGEVPLGPQ